MDRHFEAAGWRLPGSGRAGPLGWSSCNTSHIDSTVCRAQTCVVGAEARQ
jgi:hypothetical protein